MNVLLSGGTGLSNFACSAEECLSWIIILLNILTVLYLAFCAWFKRTRFVRIIGWIWAAILIGGTVAVVAKHTCIFTILSAVFSGMIVMAVISVALGKGAINDGEEAPAHRAQKDGGKKVYISGDYVVSKASNNGYEFTIRDNTDKIIATSHQKYQNVSEAKSAIGICRSYVYYADVETNSQYKIEHRNYPKFEIYTSGGKFYFVFFAMPDTIMLQSIAYNTVSACADALRRLIVIAKSGDIRIEK